MGVVKEGRSTRVLDYVGVTTISCRWVFNLMKKLELKLICYVGV